MLLIIALLIVDISAIDVMYNAFSRHADKAQRRMTECAVAMMAAVVCIGMIWW